MDEVSLSFLGDTVLQQISRSSKLTFSADKWNFKSYLVVYLPQGRLALNLSFFLSPQVPSRHPFPSQSFPCPFPFCSLPSSCCSTERASLPPKGQVWVSASLERQGNLGDMRRVAHPRVLLSLSPSEQQEFSTASTTKAAQRARTLSLLCIHMFYLKLTTHRV